MTETEKAIRDAALIGAVVVALAYIQGLYNAVEFLRHLAFDGFTDHTKSHLMHTWPLLTMIMFPSFHRVTLTVAKRAIRAHSNN